MWVMKVAMLVVGHVCHYVEAIDSYIVEREAGREACGLESLDFDLSAADFTILYLVSYGFFAFDHRNGTRTLPVCSA